MPARPKKKTGTWGVNTAIVVLMLETLDGFLKVKVKSPCSSKQITNLKKVCIEDS